MKSALSRSSNRTSRWAVVALLFILILLIAAAGCTAWKGPEPTPASPSRQAFTARRESEDGAVVSWSGYQEGYRAGTTETFELSLTNQTGQTWHGRYCLLLLAGDSPTVITSLKEQGFTLDAGMGFSDTLEAAFPEDLASGSYGLSLVVRRPGGPMVDLVPIQVGDGPAGRKPTTERDIAAALDACGVSEDRNQLIELAREDLAERVGIPQDQITVTAVQPTEFNDASLGVPEEGSSYAQVIVPGYIIQLEADGQTYRYHGGMGRVVLAPDQGAGESGSAEPPGSTLPLADQLPRDGQVVTLPLHIQARVDQADQSLTASLRWEDGTELAADFTALPGPDGSGYLVDSLDWQTESQPPQPPTQQAVLTVANASGDIVLERNLTVIGSGDPVLSTIDLYWLLGEELASEQRTVVGTGSLEAKAVEELLWGPPPRNLAGFMTALPTPEEVLTYPGRQPDWGVRVRLIGFTLDQGTAVVNLSQELRAYGGGSARVQAIREQLTRTLLQFPAVEEVEIAVEGQTEGVLQP
jgi:hypothetical protein